jgi:membrane associated rhomboid family serine protease
MMPLALVCFAIIMVFFVPKFFQYLWNTTVPEIFGLSPIRYWQAFRLLLMASMIFGAGSFLHFTFNR